MPRNEDSPYVPALGYRWLTPAYDSVVGATTRERVFKGALVEQTHPRPGQRVLDLACGTGTLAIMLKQRFPDADLTGIDGDAAVLAIASRKITRAGLAIPLDHGLSFALPYPDAHFDRVVSSLFFHHLSWPDKQRTAAELYRVLKPGGELHVADWGKATGPVSRAAFLAIQVLDGFANTRDNVAGRLVELFSAAGFVEASECALFTTLFGNIALYRAVRPVW